MGGQGAASVREGGERCAAMGEMGRGKREALGTEGREVRYASWGLWASADTVGMQRRRSGALVAGLVVLVPRGASGRGEEAAACDG